MFVCLFLLHNERNQSGGGGIWDATLRRPRLTAATSRAHATYIRYSSTASTNCPHESKSAAFLKLACHFWTDLLTSDMLAGRALSGRRSRGRGSSAGLRSGRRRRLPVSPVPPEPRRTHGHRRAIRRPNPLLDRMSHPLQKGSPARRVVACARFETRGRSGGR